MSLHRRRDVREPRPRREAKAFAIPRAVIVLMCVFFFEGYANAQEAALDQQIEAQRASVRDLERLDEKGVAQRDLQTLTEWLDKASKEYAREEIDKATELLARCLAQAEFIRHKVRGTEMRERVRSRETAARELKKKIEKLREALDVALAKKKRLERKLTIDAEERPE